MKRAFLFATTSAAIALTACTSPAVEEPVDPGPLTVYSGRNESLIGPMFERFMETSGVEVEVRYADTSELAATLLEEGANTPADVFVSQDAAALGAVGAEGMFKPVDAETLQRVAARFRANDGSWVGVSGRARAVVYNPERITEEELPRRLEDVTSPRFDGRYGVPPTNGSFQAHMAVFQAVEGEEQLEWLLNGMVENHARRYPKNSAIVTAVAEGEVDFGLVNHYYVWRALSENPEARVKVFYLPEGSASNYINMAGAGVLSEHPGAQQLLQFLLSEEAQTYFSSETFEYPLAAGVEPSAALQPLESVPSPDVNYPAVAAQLPSALERISASGLVE